MARFTKREIACVVMLAGLGIGGTAAGQSAEGAGAHAKAETPAQRDARMAWWREARCGMFIHWGLYAIPAGEWKGQTHHGEWIQHTAQIPVAEYEKLRARFNPVRFDAGAWVRTAKNAGMKYIVITTKHHDGFCLFDSEHTDYDIMTTPFQRDVMKELAEACRREGIKIGWYHSIMDWHHPDYLPRRDWENRPFDAGSYPRYVEYLRAQVKELLTNYGPIGVMWFDGEWEGTWTHEYGRSLYDFVRSLQPATIVNNRVDKGRGGMAGMTDAGFGGDYGTPEQEIPAAGMPGVDWETCMTMNDHWGYNRADRHYKSANELIRMLVDIASKGGNFLLNVGPTAEGELPPESLERLAAIGQWMKVNGESIYGTRGGPFKSLDWGRCTQRPLADGKTRLYLHVFEPPADGRLVVPGIYNQPVAARLLGDAGADQLKVSRSDDAIVIALSPHESSETVRVVALDVEGRADVWEAPQIEAAHAIFVDALDVAIRADRDRVELRYTLDGSEPGNASPMARGPVRLTDTTELRARAFRDGRAVSPVASRRFRKVTPRPADTVVATAPGLRYRYYEGEWRKLPEFSALTPAKKGVVSDFDLSVRSSPERFALVFDGYVKIPRDGVYRFFTMSDDGSELRIGADVIVSNDGLHEMIEASGDVALSAGLHAIQVRYFECTGGDGLAVLYAGPAIAKQRIAKDALVFAPAEE